MALESTAGHEWTEPNQGSSECSPSERRKSSQKDSLKSVRDQALVGSREMEFCCSSPFFYRLDLAERREEKRLLEMFPDLRSCISLEWLDLDQTPVVFAKNRFDHPKRSDQQKENVLKEGRLFSFDLMANELSDPSHHKYNEACL